MSIKNSIIIGLTGMSGAGKSTACKFFSQNGFEIVDCDKICRTVAEKGKPCLKEIAESFGQDILTDNKELNRRKLGGIIFSNPEKRLILNGIMYPYVSYLVIQRILASNNKYIILDAPTLFESGIDDICDFVVSIVADKQILLNRIIKRDGLTRSEAENRLKSQHEKDFYSSKSQFVIENNQSDEDFIISLTKAAKAIKEGL